MTKSFSIIPHPHEPSSILTTLTVTALTVSTAAILQFYFGTSRRTATSHKQKIMSNTTTDFIQYPEGTVTTPLVNRRNQKLHTLHVKNNTSTKSSTKAPPTKIFFVHGVGDHSGRPCYTRLYEFLVQQQQPQQQLYLTRQHEFLETDTTPQSPYESPFTTIARGGHGCTYVHRRCCQ
mmetsp:Transcript_736/g.1135  ORF Transcript_736/g.1135 Transcript_736/m.1135 type:complete len:177 (+) Transcript_736:131-661(+)